MSDEVGNEVREPDWTTMTRADLRTWIETELDATEVVEWWDPDWTDHYAGLDAWDVLNLMDTDELREAVMEYYA